MTKSTMTIVRDTFASLTNRTAEQEEAYQAICAELAKNAEKANANRELYETAKGVVLAHMGETPMTVAEIYEACESELPEGFSKSKVQYGLLNMWSDSVTKIVNVKGANQYTLA